MAVHNAVHDYKKSETEKGLRSDIVIFISLL